MVNLITLIDHRTGREGGDAQGRDAQESWSKEMLEKKMFKRDAQDS